jgi:hypothetical protein
MIKIISTFEFIINSRDLIREIDKIHILKAIYKINGWNLIREIDKIDILKAIYKTV